jgi:hypothetical protein
MAMASCGLRECFVIIVGSPFVTFLFPAVAMGRPLWLVSVLPYRSRDVGSTDFDE